MLIGEYEHTIDAKGRLSMPSKLRRDMGEAFIVTKGLDGCLFAFSQDEWKNFETKLKSLPLSDKNARNFVRFFLAGATECEIDKQGRFLIPSNLREAGKLEKETRKIFNTKQFKRSRKIRKRSSNNWSWNKIRNME